ncbi:MAG: hypothetical protein HN833_00480 [Elusimicrobiaceae bacterium]|jgi:hypothetical protein|nr:hypothetical protein [Elusimicrobiaceae bacterium]MBT3955582.1 hypothetical protein [Elusimicrobiaceae bacterium]MBT4008655.1 hypothetical protein [Elusimicrobiaceae bacterium]MBT4402737.1 hypothetical protein [Elusimicrobiaceae bacterium]MBT4439628.1 hypothetical protein [Elusimicrobiaceae bacterium]
MKKVLITSLTLLLGFSFINASEENIEKSTQKQCTCIEDLEKIFLFQNKFTFDDEGNPIAVASTEQDDQSGLSAGVEDALSVVSLDPLYRAFGGGKADDPATVIKKDTVAVSEKTLKLMRWRELLTYLKKGKPYYDCQKIKRNTYDPTEIELMLMEYSPQTLRFLRFSEAQTGIDGYYNKAIRSATYIINVFNMRGNDLTAFLLDFHNSIIMTNLSTEFQRAVTQAQREHAADNIYQNFLRISDEHIAYLESEMERLHAESDALKEEAKEAKKNQKKYAKESTDSLTSRLLK